MRRKLTYKRKEKTSHFFLRKGQKGPIGIFNSLFWNSFHHTVSFSIELFDEIKTSIIYSFKRHERPKLTKRYFLEFNIQIVSENAITEKLHKFVPQRCHDYLAGVFARVGMLFNISKQSI